MLLGALLMLVRRRSRAVVTSLSLLMLFGMISCAPTTPVAPAGEHADALSEGTLWQVPMIPEVARELGELPDGVVPAADAFVMPAVDALESNAPAALVPSEDPGCATGPMGEPGPPDAPQRLEPALNGVEAK